MQSQKEIFLSDNAFLGMLISSVEVYKLECHGILLGFKTKGRIVVEYAVPCQAAKRKFSEVQPNWRKELKVREVLPKLVHLQVLGGFHSHPQFGKEKGKSRLSESDKLFLNEGEIEVVVAINDEKRICAWGETKEGLSGTLGDYHITLSGFYKRKKDQKIAKFRIVCPYAVGFDFAFDSS